MNRIVRSALVVGMAWAGSMATLACQPAAAADDAVITADKAVDAALAKGDKVAAKQMARSGFQLDRLRRHHVGQDGCIPRGT